MSRAPLALGMALVVALAWARAASAEWSMFHGDTRHSGLTSVTGPSTAQLAWSYVSSDSIVYSSAAVGPEGNIYVANLAGDLLALRNNGGLRWKLTLAGTFRQSSPTVAPDGTIYLGGGDGNLYAVNPDGTLRWTYAAGAAIKTAPNVAADGTIYFGSDNGRLYALDATGAFKWSYQTGDTIRSSPAIAADGTILFGSEDFYFYALNPNGTLRWRAATGNQIKFCSPAVSSTGIVCFGSYDGYVYAFTVAGTFKWASYTAHVVRSSPAISPAGNVWIGVNDELWELAASDGHLLSKFKTLGEIYGSPAYSSGANLVYVGSYDGVFYAIRGDGTQAGNLVWSYPVGKLIPCSPAVTNAGNVVFGDIAGKVWAFGPLSSVSVEDPEDRLDLSVSPSSNPAIGAVTFPWRAAMGERRLLVHDVRGRRLAEVAHAGGWFAWDGRDREGRAAPPGVYFVRLEGGGRSSRVVLLR